MMGDMASSNIPSPIPLITFLDIEAPGLQQPDSYPIEVGWADTLGNSDAFLVFPIDTWSHWDGDAAALHGIPRSQLLEEGITVVDAACRLNSMLGVEKVFCDALAFDGFWLDRLFEAAEVEPSFQLADVYQLYGELGAQRAEQMISVLGDIQARHRARKDAERYAAAYCSVVTGQQPIL
ncbi:hypothetical protein [Halomonas salipaludis]|uniref:Exonuclease domain-containing protein n=1 Tax=Halomonas salipaludis TaxID=2032625 RepID=A0A2A2EN10_9GAMM|nr:hypothetical protein [Halomonas salipaludis]PAU73988.1 hypothetical protein CK498_24800 [Halomonas salipaludis]